MITHKQCNDWRIVPRLLVIIMVLMTITIAKWFMELPDPSTAQAGFAGIFAGAFVKFTDWYMQGSK